MDKRLFDSVRNFVEICMADNDPSHSIKHVERVVNNCKALSSEIENVDETVLLLSAWLHDVLDHKYESKTRVEEITELLKENGLSEDRINNVINNISNCGYTKNKEIRSLTFFVYKPRYEEMMKELSKLKEDGELYDIVEELCDRLKSHVLDSAIISIPSDKPLVVLSYEIDHLFVSIFRSEDNLIYYGIRGSRAKRFTKGSLEHIIMTIKLELINSLSERGFVERSMTKECLILQDADMLDAMGAIGTARCFGFSCIKGKEFVGPKEEDTSIKHFDDKLLGLYYLLHTRKAREEGLKRYKFMVEYLKQFNSELEFGK